METPGRGQGIAAEVGDCRYRFRMLHDGIFGFWVLEVRDLSPNPGKIHIISTKVVGQMQSWLINVYSCLNTA